MRKIRLSGSEGGVRLNPSSLPYQAAGDGCRYGAGGTVPLCPKLLADDL